MFPKQPAINSPTPKVGKWSGTINTGNKGGVEVAQATRYEEIKAEIESGKLQPTINAIATRINQDNKTNLVYPKCQKVAELILERMQKEGVNSRPSEGVKVGIDTVANDSPSDRSDTVKVADKKDTVKPIDFGALEEDSFSKLYEHISVLVIMKKLKPSVRDLTTETHKFIKEDSQIKSTSVSLPDCRYLANQVRDKMLMERVIINNPNYKNGLPKYLVA